MHAEGLKMSLRPEHTAPPEIFYNESEALKYTQNSRIAAIQVSFPRCPLTAARRPMRHCGPVPCSPESTDLIDSDNGFLHQYLIACNRQSVASYRDQARIAVLAAMPVGSAALFVRHTCNRGRAGGAVTEGVGAVGSAGRRDGAPHPGRRLWLLPQWGCYH